MRLPLLAVLAAVLAAGCTADDLQLPTPENTLDGPLTVHEESIDFSADPAGAQRSEPVSFPEQARALYFQAEWRPKDGAPTAVRDVRIELLDGRGDVVAECELPATVSVEGSCGPKMSNVREGPYKLAWSGFGNVVVDVRVSVE